MRHGSLFSGIGGFDLAAQWMGWENVFHCENSKFCKSILEYYWPKAISYDDIKQTDFSVHRGQVDIVTGGFPSQPYSAAGKRLVRDDERHLWPQMFRAIREIKPRWIVGENVRGLLNWNEGVVLDEIYADLEAEGYEVETYVLPAVGVNAPHRRDRVWIVAHRNAPDTLHKGLQGAASKRIQESKGGRSRFQNSIPSRFSRCDWQKFPTQPPVCGGDDGIPRELDGITFPKWRKESIKAYGNAIVPQVVVQIFKTIEAYETI